MHRHYRSSLASLLVMSIFATSLQQTASAAVIGTQQYLAALDRDAALARVDAVLAKNEVRERLEQLGVDPAAANERLAALTDQELQTLAENLENLPAGGDLLGVAGITFIVLLILELVGAIDIFNKI